MGRLRRTPAKGRLNRVPTKMPKNPPTPVVSRRFRLPIHLVDVAASEGYHFKYV